MHLEATLIRRPTSTQLDVPIYHGHPYRAIRRTETDPQHPKKAHPKLVSENSPIIRLVQIQRQCRPGRPSASRATSFASTPRVLPLCQLAIGNGSETNPLRTGPNVSSSETG